MLGKGDPRGGVIRTCDYWQGATRPYHPQRKPLRGQPTWCTDAVRILCGWRTDGCTDGVRSGCTDGVRMVYGMGVRMVYGFVHGVPKPLASQPQATPKPRPRPLPDNRPDPARFGVRFSAFFRPSEFGLRSSLPRSSLGALPGPARARIRLGALPLPKSAAGGYSGAGCGTQDKNDGFRPGSFHQSGTELAGVQPSGAGGGA